MFICCLVVLFRLGIVVFGLGLVVFGLGLVFRFCLGLVSLVLFSCVYIYV